MLNVLEPFAEEIIHLSDQAEIRLISQLVKGISRVLQRLMVLFF